MICPSSQVLSQAISDGADPALDAHLASCATCAAEWAATRDAIELARQLGAPLPPAARREEVRTMLLAAGRSAEVLAPAVRPARLRYLAIAAFTIVAAAALLLIVLVRGPEASSHGHASVVPVADARYLATTSSPDELVWLFDGSIDVQVAPLHSGERFRVLLADAEIEVHGTQFLATARGGKLVRVDVTHGVVEVRTRAGGSVLLRVGESWRAPVPVVTAVVPSSLPPVIAPPPAPIAKPLRRITKAPPP